MENTKEMETSTISINVRHPRGQYSATEKQHLVKQLDIALRWWDEFFNTHAVKGNKRINLRDLLAVSMDHLKAYFPPTHICTLGVFPLAGMSISCGEATIGQFQAAGVYNNITLNAYYEHEQSSTRQPIFRTVGTQINYPQLPLNQEDTRPHSNLAKLLLTFYVYRAVCLAFGPSGQGVYVSSFRANGYKFYHDYLKHLNLYVTELEFTNPNTNNEMVQVVWESRDFILKLLQNEIDLEAFYFNTEEYIKGLTASSRAVTAVRA